MTPAPGWTGVVMVMLVPSLLGVRPLLFIATLPKLTELAPKNPLPLMVSAVPPEDGPLVAPRPVTVGW
jgi:hypothetical protein